MDYTQNYELKKPSPDDLVRVEDFNENADLIDRILAKKVELGEDGRISSDHAPLITYGYGTCTTSGSTAAKIATVENFVPIVGATVALLFTYANTNTAATLNINDTGAYPIWARNTALTSGVISARSLVQLIFDGSYYRILSIDSLAATVASEVTRIASGSYTGNGSASRLISTGFVVRGVIVSSYNGYSSASITSAHGYTGVSGGSNAGGVTRTSSGFYVSVTNINTSLGAATNMNNYTYNYIAWGT